MAPKLTRDLPLVALYSPGYGTGNVCQADRPSNIARSKSQQRPLTRWARVAAYGDYAVQLKVFSTIRKGDASTTNARELQ